MPRLRAPESLKLMVIGTGLAVVTAGLTAAPAQAAQPAAMTLAGTVVTAPTEPIEGTDLTATPVPELSTETSTTTLLPSGEYEVDISASPINYLDETGEWAPIDTTLVEPTEESDSPEAPAEDFAAENAAASYVASIPEDASETPVQVSVDDVDGLPGGKARVALSMAGLTGAPSVEGDVATFTEVEGADAVELQPVSTGLKETIVLNDRPALPAGADRLEYRYALDVSDGLTPQLTESGSIDFVRESAPDAGPVLTIPLGNMFDSSADPSAGDGPAYTNGVDYELVRIAPDADPEAPSDDPSEEPTDQPTEAPSSDGTDAPSEPTDEPSGAPAEVPGAAEGSASAGGAGKWELVLVPDMEWLSASERVYPVMIDPTIEVITERSVRDCTLVEDVPTSSQCGDQITHLRTGRLNAGERRRAVMYFDISALPEGANVTDANVQLWLDSDRTRQDAEAGYVMNRAGRAFTTSATWNSPNGTTSTTWTGGTPSGTASEANVLTGQGASGFRFFNIRDIATGWQENRLNSANGFPNNGLVLKQQGSESIRNQLGFLSSSAQNPVARRPMLNVRYNPPIEAGGGDRAYWDYEERELTDRITAKVNIGNGNLLVSNQDTSVAGVAGWDMSMVRYYNSTHHNIGPSNMGAGWSHGFGASVRLFFPNNDSTGERSRIRYIGESGFASIFTRNGTTNTYNRQLPGITADLEYKTNPNRYELQWFDESVYVFDTSGQLQVMRDMNGNELTFAYRASDNRLGSVTDTRGRTAHMLYTPDTGLIQQMQIRRPGPASDPQGGEPMLTWRYTYTQPGDGSIARLASAELESFSASAIGASTTVDSAAGSGGSGGNIAAQTQYSYDNLGRLTSIRDARDVNAGSTRSIGGTTNFTYDAGSPRVQTMTRVTDSTSVPDSTTRFTYFGDPAVGANGSTSTCVQNDADAAFRTHIDGERADVEDITRHCIDSAGRVLRTTDAENNKRSSAWSANSNVTAADLSGTGSGAEMHMFTYDSDDENLEGTTSPEGSTTGATYGTNPGSDHSPTATQGDDTGGTEDTWRYDYDNRNNLVRARTRDNDDNLGIVYEYCWTNQGQISRIMPGTGDGTANSGANVNCAPGSQGDDTLFTYNTAHELTQVDRPSGGDQSYTYDNLSRIATATDGRGVITRYTYDAMDRVVETRYSRSGDTTQVATWDYDLAGNTAVMGNIDNPQVTSEPLTKTFAYDELNRLTSERPQSPSTVTTYSYDAAGNVTRTEVSSETSAGLEPTTYQYDRVNRLTALNDQRTGVPAITFEYDQRDNRVRTVFPIMNADGSNSGNPLVQRSVYDRDSNMTCTFSYRQNALSPGTTCPAASNGALITYRGYNYRNPDENNVRTSTKYTMTDIQNRTTRLRYDSIKRLTEATTRNGTAGTDPLLRRFAYDYDKRSNLTNETTTGTTPGLETGRLQMAFSPGDEVCASVRQSSDAGLTCGSGGPSGQTRYTHDAAGNMTDATGGSTSNLNGLALRYNLPGQTTSISAPGGAHGNTTGSAAYDGVEQDRRNVAGSTTMSYGFSGDVNAQNTSGSTPTGELFVRDPGGDLLAMLSRTPSAPGTITDVDYYLLDDQKSVIATHDGQGNLTGDGLTRYLYEPYGQIIRSWIQPGAGAGTGDGAEDSGAAAPSRDRNPFTYVSGYHDRATGLIKFGTRYYAPSLGTWTQPDPENGSLSAPLTLNKFNYSGSNPCNNSDPSGRSFLECSIKYSAFVGGVAGALYLRGGPFFAVVPAVILAYYEYQEACAPYQVSNAEALTYAARAALAAKAFFGALYG